MTFNYTKDQGQIYLDRIDYAGNSTASPSQPTTNYVKFYLESRTDAPDMYSTNFRVKTSYRLKTIAVYSKIAGIDELTRAYALVYDADPNTADSQYSASTGRSLLYSLQRYGNDASVDPADGTVTGVSSLPK